ncbi:MAG: SDR family NAD(P)-dependent oxidoreductase, partial [Nitrososphaerales archaeon]
MPYEINLGDRTALVTGAARGIGRAISLELSNAGASIVVNDLSAQDCEGTVEEIKSKGGKAISFGADVSDKAQVEGMIAKAVEVFGSLDILVNNAGTVVRKSAIELSEEEWDKTIDVNLKGAFLCSQSAIRRMIESKRKGCNIINISSVLGDVALPPRSAYSASKGGMISL